LNSHEHLSVTINAGWVQSNPVGSRFEGPDGRVYVVDSMDQASMIDVDDPGISAPIWVVRSHPAED